jgi:RNA polymerase sigma factor (sigma-70 family)
VHGATLPYDVSGVPMYRVAPLCVVKPGMLPAQAQQAQEDMSGAKLPSRNSVGPAPEFLTSAVGEPLPRDNAAEDALVSSAVAGNSQAFRALYTKYRSVVSRVVFRMGTPPSELDDAVQDVFVQVHRSLRDFRGQAKFSTWLHRVAVNVVLMQRRARKSRPAFTDEADDTLLATNALPDEDAERRERMRAFERVLARLGDKKRAVFVLHDLEGVSPAEIAKLVSAPVLTVRTRLFYARREIEAMLPDEPSLARLRGSFTGTDPEAER